MWPPPRIAWLAMRITALRPKRRNMQAAVLAIYCWYSPRQQAKQRPRQRDSLPGETAETAGKLQVVLNQFTNARPTELDRAFKSATRGKAAKKKE